MTKIRVSPPASGMYLRPCAMPRGTPDVLLSMRSSSALPRATWRVLFDTPDSRFGVLEGWGDVDSHEAVASDDPTARILTMIADPEVSEDIAPMMHPLFDVATVDDHLARAAVDGRALSWSKASSRAGIVHSSSALTEHIRCDFEVLHLWRAPYLILQVAATRRSIGASTAQCTLRIPGFADVPIRVGVVGQTTDLVFVLTRIDQTLADPISEQAAAVGNRYSTEDAAICEDWTGSFCGAPVCPVWDAPTVLRLSSELTPRPEPDAPGADGAYGMTSAASIWSTTGAVLGAIRGLLTASAAYCDRQDGWVCSDGSEVASWPARPQLTFDEGYPWKGLSWQNDANDPRDTLGYPIPRSGFWPSVASGRLPADAEHVSVAPLAAAATLTGRLGLRTLCRRQGLMLSYERAFAVTLEPGSRSDWTPSGRHCARPIMAICALGAVDRAVDGVVRTVLPRWMAQVERKQLEHGLPADCPCVPGAIASGGIMTPYEEVLISEAAMMYYRITSDRAALRVARRQGRYGASKLVRVQQPGETIAGWHGFYQAPWKSDGSLTFVGDPGTVIAGNWLNRWFGALTNYLAACGEMARLGMLSDLDPSDQLWIAVAQASLATFHAPFNLDSPTEMNAWANQAMPTASIVALAKVTGAPIHGAPV